MTQETFPLINGDVLRATKLDACGVPAWGEGVSIATEGFITVAVTANYDEGTDIAIKNAKGKRCVQRHAEEELQNLSVTATFCNVNPDLYTLLTGFPKITNLSGVVVGFRVNRGIRPVDVHVALEVWMDAFADSACDENGDVPYGYFLWPFLRGGRVADYTIENNAVTFSVNAMVTKDGSGWGIGPYDVADDALGAAQALYDGITSLDHQVTFRTLIAPPTANDTLVPLDDPDTAAATTATAGTPGTFNGVRPATLAALQASSIAGSGGVTAWTTGQWVVLGNGSLAHWAGSGATPKWVTGKA